MAKKGKTPQESIEDISVEDVFGEDVVVEETTVEEEGGRKDPPFNIAQDLEAPPMEAKTSGKKKEITLVELRPQPNGKWNSRTAFVEIDGKRHVMFLNPRQAYSLYCSGVTPSSLPVKGTVCLYRHTADQSLPGTNFSFDGVLPNYKPKKDKDGNDILNQVNIEFDEEWKALEGGSPSTNPVSNAPVNKDTGWVKGHAEVMARIDALAEVLGKPINEEYYEARKEEWINKIVDSQ